jgi:deoxycytidine triphosphate deaminase
MILNYEEIKELNIIDSPTENEFGNASYNLTIEKIIDMNHSVTDSFTLKPQGMVYVVFKEKLNVPENIVGFAHVKTTLTKLGIMATNIGIIDPTYSGYMSTLLINFGKVEHRLCKGDTALRITFSYINKPKKVNSVKISDKSQEDYLEIIQKKITHLDEKFLNLNSIQSQVETNVKKELFLSIRNYVGLFTVGSFLVATIFQVKGCYERKNDKMLKGYETVTSTYGDENRILRTKLDNFEIQIKSLNDSITMQSKVINQLKGKKK